MPLVLKCPNAGLNPDGIQPVDVYHPAARNGTIVHKVVEYYLQDGTLPVGLLDGIEGEEELDRCRTMVYNILGYLDSLPVGKVLTEIEVETELKGCIVRGHVDITVLTDKGPGIVDLKTGRMSTSHYDQVASYAAGVCNHPAILERYGGKPETVYAAVLYLDSNTADRYKFTQPDLTAWCEMVDTTIGNGGYAINDGCTYCPLKTGCPAFREYAEWESLPVLEEPDDDASLLAENIEQWPVNVRQEVWQRIREIESAIQSYKRNIKKAVKKAGGEVDLGERSLVIQQRQNKQVNSKQAIKVLSEYLDPDELAECVSVSLTDVLNKLDAMTPSGKKKKTREKVLDKLEKAGALSFCTTDMLTTKKNKKQVDSE